MGYQELFEHHIMHANSHTADPMLMTMNLLTTLSSKSKYSFCLAVVLYDRSILIEQNDTTDKEPLNYGYRFNY
jgi:hypothetical protein